MKKTDNWELLERICNQVKNVKPIDKEEEIRLYSKIISKNKIKEVRGRLIEGYMWLVVKISGQLLVDKCSNRDDILNSGILELCRCANKFKIEPGKKFVNFASKCIRGRMWKEMRRSDSMVPIPRIKDDVGYRINNIISLSTIVYKDRGKDSSVHELWEFIPDPNQLDIDEKIDQERFCNKFRLIFNKVLKEEPISREIIVDSEGLFDEDRISVIEAGKRKGMINRQLSHWYKSKGMRLLRESGEIRELYESL